MNRTTSTRAVIIRLILFTTLIAALAAGIVVAIQRPLGADTVGFEADFTDAGGLHTNDDVRMFGVAVGKVQGIDLIADRARVRFTVAVDRPMYVSSIVAVRYQNLAGQRYLDIRQPDSPTTKLAPGTVIGTDHTVPSFDITTLFNGLEPMLTELSPEALNQFLRNALAVIQGDGKAVGATLDSIAKLSDLVTDR
ncbi:MlaD family protein [Nocardia crassostreae]|uniref:MlaD family protein n=1 Tax=Nocardia crassostreae TaxID=53428 RepID=UPI000AC568BC|nr:MlaD family protein [Nocardia crassostreae]